MFLFRLNEWARHTINWSFTIGQVAAAVAWICIIIVGISFSCIFFIGVSRYWWYMWWIFLDRNRDCSSPLLLLLVVIIYLGYCVYTEAVYVVLLQEAAGICAFSDTVSFTWKLNACRDLVSSRDHLVSSRDESFHLVISRALRIAIQIAIVIADSSRDESSHLVTSRVISRSSRDHHEMIFVVPNYISPKDYLVGKARSYGNP